MAAHAYTVLKSTADGKEDPAQFANGLDYAKFGDNIGLWRLDDWTKLHIACTQGKQELVEIAQGLLPIYHERWRELGCPETAEEWRENDLRIWKLMRSLEEKQNV